MMPRTVRVAALGAVVWACGCGAGAAPPNDQWAAAQADVGRAQAGGAPEVPDARLHLQLAQEDLQKAKQAMGQDNERAASLFAVASTEAQLALSLANEAKAEDRARGARAELQKASSK